MELVSTIHEVEYPESANRNSKGADRIPNSDESDASLIRVGLSKELRFDTSKPDGMPFKALDASALTALGWQPAVPFEDALQRTYQWFLQRQAVGASPSA